jgi:hypothetical protein
MIDSRRMRWAVYVVCMDEKRNTYRFSVGKPEEKRPLRRRRSRWENNIEIDLTLERYGVIYIGFIWLRIGPIEGCCEHGNEPSGSKNGAILEWLSDWRLLRRTQLHIVS